MHNLPTGTVTLLFADMAGATHLYSRLGDRYTQVLAESRQVLRTAFAQWNGHVVDTQDDTIFVVFARATDAMQAVVAAQRALISHAFAHGTALQVRMGLHTGEPQQVAEGYVGLDVHRAAFIMSAGHGGQVLLSQTSCSLVEQDLPEGVHLRDLGEHRLKELGRPMRLFQLVISGLLSDFPPLHTLERFPDNLPAQPTPLLGREHEVADLRDLLLHEDVRLLTLTGPGGTGKTRLALQVAADLSDRFSSGVFFVNLAPLSDPTLVVPTIAEAFAIREGGDQTLLSHLTEELRARQMLLLLDNFEQVVDAAEQIATLVATCPHLKVLVTSREILHVRAEREFPVPPLAVPDPDHLSDLATLSRQAAVALFLQQAQAVKPGFQLTDINARAIAELCARLDGLPLAIELAAARMKLFSPRALLARLDQRLSVLTSAARDVPARQQTLRNTIAWSYNLLDAEEQRLFRKLSVFVNGCNIETIEAVCAPSGGESVPTLDRVASLVNKSLLQSVEQHLAEEPRFVMLETIREYALERLEAHGETGEARRAHALSFLALAEQAEQGTTGPQQAVVLEHLEQEHDNLRAAMHWLTFHTGDGGAMALRLGAALTPFWFVRAYLSEGRDFLKRVLARSEDVPAQVQAKALYAASQLYDALNVHDRAEELCEQSLALYRKLADAAGIANGLHLLADIVWGRGNLYLSRKLAEESLMLFREIDDNRSVAYLLYHLGSLAAEQGEYARGRDLFMESVTIDRKLGDTRVIALSLFRLAQLAWVSEGNQAQACIWLDESFALSREVGDKEGIANCLYLSGILALHEGDTAGATLRVEQAAVLFQEIKRQDGIARSFYAKARIAAAGQDAALSQALYEQGVRIARSAGDTLTTIPGLEGLAAAIAAQGNHVQAAHLWAAAQILRETIGAPLPPVERVLYQQTVEATRTLLGEQVFASAWSEGSTLSIEQALAIPEQETLAIPSQGERLLSPPSYPGELTRREAEVLRIVAQGLTNEQVARRLAISPRTVDTHLTSIYSKIGVTSRVAATRYAIEHHLV